MYRRALIRPEKFVVVACGTRQHAGRKRIERHYQVRMDIDLGKPPRRSARRDGEQPLRILIIGNFSGNVGAATGPTALAARRLDLDSFDSVMAALNPQLELVVPGLGES